MSLIKKDINISKRVSVRNSFPFASHNFKNNSSKSITLNTNNSNNDIASNSISITTPGLTRKQFLNQTGLDQESTLDDRKTKALINKNT